MVKVIASASIFYGLTVSAADLVAAAWAYEQLEPALRALNMIEARASQGILQIGPSGRAVGRVPSEIWALIGARAVEREVERARVGMVAELYGHAMEELGDQVWDARWMDGGPEGANRLEAELGFPWTDGLAEGVSASSKLDQV